MITPLFFTIAGYALFSGLWWVLQRRLFLLKIPKSIILLTSGISAGVLVIAALMIYGVPAYSSRLLALVLLDIVLNSIIAYCFVSAIEKSNASLASSVTAFAPVLAIITGRFLFGEIPGLLGNVGIVVILIGTYVLHLRPQQGNTWYTPFAEMWRVRHQWLWYAVGAAIAAGFSIPIAKQIITQSNFLFEPGIALLFGWGLVWGIWAILKGDFRKIPHNFDRRKLWGMLLLMGGCFAIANASQGAAYYYGYAASVGALKRLDGPVTVFLAWLLLKEKNIKHRFLGAVIIALGAVLIGLDRV